MSTQPETVKVRWTCANAVSAPYWQTVDIYESDECGHEFETEEDREEFKEGLCSAACPRCQQELSQKIDNPEIVE